MAQKDTREIPGIKACICFALIGIAFTYFLNFDLNELAPMQQGSLNAAQSIPSISNVGSYSSIPTISTISALQANSSPLISTTIPAVTVPSTTTVYVFNPSTATQSMNISLKVYNDEMPGMFGYWALGNYTRTVKAYYIGNSSYYLIIGLNGTWNTFAGALSPKNGSVQPANGSGTFNVAYTAIESNVTLNKSAQLSGYIGAFNLNGTQQDIANQTYNNQSGISNNTFSWTQRYFGFQGVPQIYGNYSAVFKYNSETFSIRINSTKESVIGDIVT